MSKTPLVISYLRFSTPEQEQGDSKRRQLEASADWAAKRGLTIAENLQDLGISAFRGKNAQKGALGRFLELVRAGKIPEGSILLVESLDRLSRNELIEALEQFLAILRAGIKIVTLQDGFEYQRDGLNLQNLMYSLMIMSTAHEESAKKSHRLGKAWEQKRKEMAEGKPLTGALPSWLRLQDGKIVPVPEKAAFVRRIFKMALSGMGLGAITKALNADTKNISGRVEHINRSYVFKILHNKAVLGEFQPYKNQDKKRKPIGQPLPDYYPRVIDDTTFYAVQKILADKQKTGGPTSKHVNLFSGLIIDARDGSHWQTHEKWKGAKKYASAKCLLGIGEYYAFPVDAFETAFFLAMSPYIKALPKTAETDTLTDEIAALQAQLAETDRRIEAIGNQVLTGGSSAAVVDLLNKLDAQKHQQQKQLDGLRAQTATRSKSAMSNTVAEYLALAEKAMKGNIPYEERVALRGLIRRVVAGIEGAIEKTVSRNTQRGNNPLYQATVRVVLLDGQQVIYVVRAEKNKVSVIPVQEK